MAVEKSGLQLVPGTWETMTPWDVVSGWPRGIDPPSSRLAWTGPPETPREALEADLREQLVAGPVVIAFSGGRDSSVLLAVAVQLARREALPLPDTRTLVYPGHEDAEESECQARVLEHLGLTEQPLVVHDSAEDVLGPTARAVLRTQGVAWPPGGVLRAGLLASSSGATVVTGEAGDEVLGARRLSPVVGVLCSRRVPRGNNARALLYALSPSPVRREALHRLTPYDNLLWLRPEVRERFERERHTETAREPLDHARSTSRVLRRRALTMGLRNQDRLATALGSALHHPFVTPRFEASLRTVGRRGWVNRTQMIRMLVGDELPEDVIARTSKAAFNHAAVADGARAFARRWQGGGVDEEYVDPDALRAEWLSEVPHAGTFALLQQAWLAEEGAAGT